MPFSEGAGSPRLASDMPSYTAAFEYLAPRYRQAFAVNDPIAHPEDVFREQLGALATAVKLVHKDAEFRRDMAAPGSGVSGDAERALPRAFEGLTRGMRVDELDDAARDVVRVCFDHVDACEYAGLFRA